MPRLAMSVATSTRSFPLLNPVSAQLRYAWVLSECGIGGTLQKGLIRGVLGDLNVMFIHGRTCAIGGKILSAPQSCKSC